MLTPVLVMLAISIVLNVLLYKAIEDHTRHPERFLTEILNWKECSICHQLVPGDLAAWIEEDSILEVCPACWAGMNSLEILRRESPERFDEVMAALTDIGNET